MYTIEIALTEKQKNDAFWVRHKTFKEEEGKFQGHIFPGKKMKNPHDDDPKTIILIAYYQKNAYAKKIPVGTIAAYAYSQKLELPIMDTIKGVYDLQKLMEQREFKSPLFSCGMLAIVKDHRGASGISIWLYRMILEFARRRGCEDVVATINYKIEKIVLAVGFCHLLPESWYSEEIGNHIFLMYGKTSDIAKVLEIQKVPAWCEKEFSESTKIKLWRNEDIIIEGERGNDFYWIIEGSAKVVARTKNRDLLLAILYQGETFGEMSAFYGRRTATVKANYCAAKELSNKELLGIIHDIEKAKSFAGVLIKRLTETNKKVKNRFSIENIFAPLLKKGILKSLPIRTCALHEYICKFGECERKAYIIKSGEIGIMVPINGVETLIGTMKAPSIFGYMVFFNDTRNASIITLEKTELYEIEEGFFMEFFCDLKNRKELIKKQLLLIGDMNKNLSDSFKHEHFLQNFKIWLVNYYKTADLQKKVSDVEEEIIDQVSRLSIKCIAQEFGTLEKEVEELFEQLVQAEILDKEFRLLDEERLKDFKFNF